MASIPKSDKTYKICSNYHEANDMSVVGIFLLPRVDDLIDKLSCAKFMSKSDLTKGFWQILIDPNCKVIVLFITLFGHYIWNYMPFALKGSSSTFKRTMCKALKGLKDFTGIYLDNVIIASDTWELHLGTTPVSCCYCIV